MILKLSQKTKAVIMLLLLSAFLVIILFNAVLLVLKTVYPLSYSALVEANSAEYDIDESLLYAVIETESGFNKDAVSSVGAMGLTQILPETFRWLQGKTGDDIPDEALFEPEVSVKYGAYLISILEGEFGNTETAVAAYHAGIGNVHKWLENPEYSDDGITLKHIPFDDTRAYVDKVMRTRDIYIRLYNLKQPETEEIQNVNS